MERSIKSSRTVLPGYIVISAFFALILIVQLIFISDLEKSLSLKEIQSLAGIGGKQLVSTLNHLFDVTGYTLVLSSILIVTCSYILIRKRIRVSLGPSVNSALSGHEPGKKSMKPGSSEAVINPVKESISNKRTIHHPRERNTYPDTESHSMEDTLKSAQDMSSSLQIHNEAIVQIKNIIDSMSSVISENNPPANHLSDPNWYTDTYNV